MTKKHDTEPPTNPLAAWVHLTTDIPNTGLDRERAASEDERAAIAGALGIPAIERLVANYRIRAIAGGGWRLSGTVSANVVQSCIVTLEPVAGTLNDDFATEFWRDESALQQEDELSVLSGPEAELLEGDEIEVGRVVFEIVSASLDPYPRKSGAEFDWAEKDEKDVGKTSPFAVLSKLKDKQ